MLIRWRCLLVVQHWVTFSYEIPTLEYGGGISCLLDIPTYLCASQIVRENTEIEWNQTHCCRTHAYDGLLDAPKEGALATQTPSLWNLLLQKLRKLWHTSQIYGPKSNSSGFLDRLDEALHGFCDRTNKQERCPEQLALCQHEAVYDPERTYSTV
jgi:hypothetical protein